MPSAQARMPYALCLVCGDKDFELPKDLGDGLISATPSCLVIGCRPDCDASTEFIIGDLSEVAEPRTPLFTGSFDTLQRTVSILDVFGECILSHRTVDVQANLSIWVDDEQEPGRIVVGIG